MNWLSKKYTVSIILGGIKLNISCNIFSHFFFFFIYFQSTLVLLKSLEGELTAQEAEALEAPVHELQGKYHQLLEALADRCQALDAALVQSQGVQDALDTLGTWLNSSEGQLK